MINNKTTLNSSLFTDISSGAIDNIMGITIFSIEIGENGNWWINGKDTGVSATGPKGEPGTTIHKELSDLDFENSGHTGFASSTQLNDIEKDIETLWKIIGDVNALLEARLNGEV